MPCSLAYAQALIVDKAALVAAQKSNDVAKAQEILQQAYRTAFRPHEKSLGDPFGCPPQSQVWRQRRFVSFKTVAGIKIMVPVASPQAKPALLGNPFQQCGLP